MRRILAATLTSTLLVGTLALPAGADGGVESFLLPPPSQTAVKPTDVMELDGVVPDGTTALTATLHAVTLDGTVLQSFDISSRLVLDGTDVNGTLQVSCFYIPGCFDGDDALRASVAGYVLELATTAGSDRSERLDLDEQDPFLLGYSLVDPTHVVVRFSEDVVDPERDSPLDWEIDGQRTVTAVEGVGDQRTLTLLIDQAGDATPEVRYRPQPSPIGQIPNVPYVDGAGNGLLAANRFAKAADRIPPPVPAIELVDDEAPSYDGQDQAIPVLGADPTPVVTVGEVPQGAIAELYLDDGDGRFEAHQDTLLDESPSTADPVQLTPASDLPDGVHRFFARSRDLAACDPNDVDGEQCPNWSGRSMEATYDLETDAPFLIGPATATRNRVVVLVSDTPVGESTAADWTIPGGPAITDVELSGTFVVLTLASDAIAGEHDQLVYEPTGGNELADDHGNRVAAAILELIPGALPVLFGSAAELVEGDGPANPLDALTYEEQTATFALQLDQPSVGASSVDYELVGRTATGDEDFTVTTGTIDFADAATDAAVVVEAIGDVLDEADESFALVLSNPVGIRLPGEELTLELEGTVLDDDLLPGLSVDDIVLEEGETGSFTVTLDAPSGRTVEVDYELVGDTAELGSDVTTGSGTLVFAPEDVERTVTVSALIDGVDEDGERFELRLTQASNATVEDAVGAGSIIDVDDAPQLFVRDASGREGDTLGVVVGLRGRSERVVTVDLVSTDDTAIGGADYTAVDTTLTIAPGQQQAVLPVRLLVDALDESLERFHIEPRSATNATYTNDSTGTVLVTDRSTVPGTSGTGGGSATGGAGTPTGGSGGDGGPLGSPLPTTGGGAGLVALGLLGLGARLRRR